MKKLMAVFVLLLCLISFVVVPAMAAQDDKIITPKQKAADKLKEHKDKKVVEQKVSHNKADFTNEVPGVGNLKYESEKVPPGFEKKQETVTMVSWHNGGRLHIRDTVHRTTTIQVPWSTLQNVEGFDGEHVRIWHYDDAGVCDGKWVQTIANEGGFAYLESVPFSEIIVGGFTGTYSKVDNEIDITDTINLGRTFDSDEVSSVSLSIDDQYSTKTDPYDIDTTGLVFWGRFDDAGSTVIDYSGNGNNGTFAAATYAAGKYNNAGVFDGIDNEVICAESPNLVFTDEISYGFIVNPNEYPTDSIIEIGRQKTGAFVASYRGDVGTKYWEIGIVQSNGISRFISTGDLITADDIPVGEFSTIIVTANGTNLIVDINGEEQGVIPYDGTLKSTAGQQIIIGSYGGSRYFNGTIDNVFLYNRSLTPTERKELYYISASSLQAKTNSHAEYSDYWNSSADNPLSVPFGASESISSLTFNQPESIVQNGVTIYNPINVLFNTTATIGYTEDTYLIEEFCDEGFYIDQYAIEITHTPSADNANGLISYNPTDSLCCDIMDKSWTYELETDNPAASITTFDCNSLVIDTGAITAGIEYSYTVIAETNHIYSDGLTATQQGASIWGTGVSILNVAFTISILAAGIVALKNSTDPEKSAMPALKALIGLAIGLLVFTLIATLGTGIGSAIESILGV